MILIIHVKYKSLGINAFYWQVICIHLSSIWKKTLKTLDTIGNCLRSVFSLGVTRHMHKITTCETLSLICRWSCEITLKEKKTPLSQEVVCFQIVDSETSKSKLEVSKSNSWKMTPFSKTTSLRRELFLTICYAINLSPYSLPRKVLC